MPSIPLFAKLIMGTVAAAAGVLAGILGNVLAINVVYRITKRGRKPTERPRTVWILFYLSTMAFVVLGTLVALAPLPPEHSDTSPESDDASVEANANTITASVEGPDYNSIVYSQRNRPLWRVELDSMVANVVVDDIDLDGSLEIIAATRDPGPTPGWLYVLNEKGNILDEHNIWKPSIYGGQSPQSRIVDFQIVDLNNNGAKDLVVISTDLVWFPSRLAVLNLERGKLVEVAEYWNSGFIETLDIADINDDGILEIVCTAQNNDLRSVVPTVEGNVSSVFLLDGSSIFVGKAVWYGYVTPESTGVSDVAFVDIDGDSIREIQATLSNGCSYYLDTDGRIVEQGKPSGQSPPGFGQVDSCEDALHIIRQ